MRTFLTRGVLGVLGALVLSLAACDDSGSSSARDQALQQKADFWDIAQIEERFHEATTTKDIDMMMSLWAPNATLTVGPGQTAAGVEQIRRFWLEKSAAFLPTNDWISDHPAWKVSITVNGDRGTLHFECHYIDATTHEVVLTTAADQDVARINGEWLITDMVAGSAPLSP
jgi:ketosteroid isomerase-like protein